MTIEMINRTSYDSLMIIIDGEQFILGKDQCASKIVQDGEVSITAIPSDNCSVLVNWLFIAIDGFLSEEHIVNSLVGSAQASVKCTDESTVIVLKDLHCRDDKEGYIYDSVYFDSQSCSVVSVEYSLKEFSSAKKKAWALYTFVFSLLPLQIVGLIWLLFSGDISILLIQALALFLFSIPSWRRARKVKKQYSDEVAGEMLKKQSEVLKSNNGEEPVYESSGVIEKAVYKILDFFTSNKK